MYIGAFCRSQSRTEYYAYITQFLFDPDISPNNLDDFELFQDLIFESHYGKLHINYYYDQLDRFRSGRGKSKRTKIIRRLARYAEFLGKHSEMFLEDMYNYIFRHHPNLIQPLLDALPSSVKLSFIRVAEHYPQIVRQVPKLKLYMLYS